MTLLSACGLLSLLIESIILGIPALQQKVIPV
jgi:hypothetical protein